MEKVVATCDFLKKYAEIFRTQNSSAITKMEKQPGFQQLILNMRKAVHTGMDEAYFTTYATVKLPKTLGLPESALREYTEEIEALLHSEGESNWYAFSLTFANGFGQSFMFTFLGRRRTGKVDFTYGYTSCSFQLAPTTVITRRKKSGFFSSSAWDEISYLPAGITKDEITGVLGNMICELAK